MTYEPLPDRTAEIGALFTSLQPNKPAQPKERGQVSPTLDDQQIIDLARNARNGDKFERLYGGDINGHVSHSEADEALCFMLAFWTQDFDQIDRIFRASGLMRDKWDRKLGGGTYGSMAINKALDHVAETYQGEISSKPSVVSSKPKAIDLLKYNLTDAGNAERLVALHGDKIRFCKPMGITFIWDGRRWAEDEKGEVYLLALDAIRKTHLHAFGMQDNEERRSEIIKKTLGFEQRPKLEAMVTLARYDSKIAVLPDDLDRGPWRVNVLNGTLYLKGTAKLLPHNPNDLITKIAPVEYDPKAKAPLWLKVLGRIFSGNQELISFVQRIIGSALTGVIKDQVLFFFYGTGANGKTTLLMIILYMLGDYAIQAAPNLLVEKKNEAHPTEVAALKGTRLAVCTETGQSKRMAEVLLKQLTGGDRITARRMRQDFFQFNPTHKLILQGNHKPIIKGTDQAIWRRIKVVPFSVTIPEEEQDKDLEQKLRAELPGIFAWAVEGCLAWQREGLNPPDEVKAATQSYRDEMDSLRDFLSERCIIEPQCLTSAADLYGAYIRWSEQNRERPMNNKNFGLALAERGFEKARGTGGRVIYYGIGIITDDE